MYVCSGARVDGFEIAGRFFYLERKSLASAVNHDLSSRSIGSVTVALTIVTVFDVTSKYTGARWSSSVFWDEKEDIKSDVHRQPPTTCSILKRTTRHTLLRLCFTRVTRCCAFEKSSR